MAPACSERRAAFRLQGSCCCPPPHHPSHQTCLTYHPTSARSKVPKKVTTCAFTADGGAMLAADKFGDVLVAATQRPAGGLEFSELRRAFCGPVGGAA